jgi:hypothetical protein
MLPKIEHPVHEVYLKSLDKKVRFRPFLVKEEKLLLMAKESDDIEEITKSVKQIITNCCLDEIDVDKLPTFDVEMFFLHLRMRSVGEAAQMIYTCDKVVDSNTCGHQTEFELDLKNIVYDEAEGHSNIIKLTDSIGVSFNYPSLNMPEAALNEKFEDGGYELISQYLDYIYDSEQIYKRDTISKEEITDFFDNLSLLKQEIECKKCGNKNSVNVEGILSFFD